MTRACKTCQWWFSGGGSEGVCRGGPPTTFRPLGYNWPTTRADDWCGVYQVRAALIGGDVRKPHPHQDGEA
mgnify:CR=1 FL=1